MACFRNVIRFSIQSDGGYAFLSNLYPSSPFKLNGVTWKSVEHCYQAHKFSNSSRLYCNHIAAVRDPADAWALGARMRFEVGGSDVTEKRWLAQLVTRHAHVQIRHDWDAVKETVMSAAVHAKFYQNARLCDLLCETKGGLVCADKSCDAYWGGSDNRLGTLLEQLRSEMVIERGPQF